MWHILEIVIIILAGLASAAFLARYFFISSRTKKKAGCGGSCNGECGIGKKENFLKTLENNKKPDRKV